MAQQQQQQQFWSAENATNAYLQALEMGKRSGKDDDDQTDDVSEFISAVAAGNNAQLMVIVCGSSNSHSNNKPASVSPILALMAAAQHTGGQVVCVFPSLHELQSAAGSEEDVLMNVVNNNNFPHGPRVHCVVGDARRLLAEEYCDADFILVDCAGVGQHEEILQILQRGGSDKKEVIFLGYNALRNNNRSWRSMKPGGGGLRTQLLPIGQGLLVARIGGCNNGRRKGNWVVTVDEVTGEEHVFRVKSPRDLKGI